MKIYMFFILCSLILTSIYLLGRAIDASMKFLHLNNETSRLFSTLVRALGILLPTFVVITALACLATINVPINFIIILLLALMFGNFVMEYVAGLIFLISSRATIKDSITVAGKGGEIISLNTFSLSLQSPQGRLILPYSHIFKKGYTITRKLHVANRFDIVIELGAGDIDFEETKSDLISILSNGGYIGKFSSPTFKINHHTNQVLIQIYLDSMEDPMDLILLLKEKTYVCH